MFKFFRKAKKYLSQSDLQIYLDYSSAVLAAILLLAAVLVVKGVSSSYTKTTMSKYEQMKKPVQLHWKEKNTFWYSVVLKDANGHTERFGNLSKIANEIGEKFNVGDTVGLAFPITRFFTQPTSKLTSLERAL